MAVVNPKVDGGKPFDWGKASADYAKYRDIYPEMFYRQILDAGLCVQGQTVLDLGTGTGVLPRNLYRYGAQFVGIDLSPEQIEQARRLAKQAGMQIFRIILLMWSQRASAFSILMQRSFCQTCGGCSGPGDGLRSSIWHGCRGRTRLHVQASNWYSAIIRPGAAGERPGIPSNCLLKPRCILRSNRNTCSI